MASGTPSSTQTTVEATDVCRLSCSAATDDSLVMSSKNRDQSSRRVSANSGRITNSAPKAAGTYSQRGKPA